MRVITGSARGRPLRAGKGRAIRPTGARLKAAIFSILGSRWGVEGRAVLDLFAGSGALGIEAASRGAARVVFVERDAAAVRILRENVGRCGLQVPMEILAATLPAVLRRPLAGAPFGGVFLDPPYDTGLVGPTLAELGRGGLVAPAGWVVVEHSGGERVADAYGSLRLTDARRYGKTALAIFLCDGENEPHEAQQ